MTDILHEAQDTIRRSLAGSRDRACFTCSFQAEDVALLHLIRREHPEIPVLFLETGYHFAATYEYRDRLVREWNLKLVNLAAQQSVEAQESAFGNLFASDPGRCCQLRKVEPLMEGLSHYDVWFTGLRREQSPTRAHLQLEEAHRLPGGREIRKISPLAAWKWNDVWSYLNANEIPHLPLYDEGYTSIGCEPCTAKPVEGDSLRSGRWGGKKLECGIHTFSEGAAH